MIKPSSLWSLLKTCTEDAWLGRVCRAIGGQEVELDFGQKQMVAQIIQDSSWMDEARDELKEKWAKNKRTYRSKKGKCPPMSTDVLKTFEDIEMSLGQLDVSQCPQDNGVSTDVSSLPSILPSILPNNKNIHTSVCIKENARTRLDIPSLEEVVSAATSLMGVPESYARWWYTQMAASDWKTTKGNRVDHNNWRALLKAWHNRAKSEELVNIENEFRASKPKAPRDFTLDDWLICQERCSLFIDGRCKGGKIIPPPFRPYPIPPEECDRFKPIKEE